MESLDDFRILPETIEAWTHLTVLSRDLQRIHLWRPTAGKERLGAPGFEQHCIPTIVVCIHGVTEVEGLEILTLSPGDVLVIGAGTWHRHLALQATGACLRLGYFLGKSDFHLVVGSRNLVGSIPRELRWGLLQESMSCPDTAQQRDVVAGLLNEAVSHGLEPLAFINPAMVAMEYALWKTLHLNQGVQRIISASGLHRAQAYRLAHAHWGMGISHMRMRARMQLAGELLNVHISVAETAFRCGFGNVRSFSRAFHSFHGSSPASCLRMSTHTTFAHPLTTAW